MSVNGLHRDRVKVRDRVSGRVRVSVRVRACRPDSSGNLLTRHKMEFAPVDCTFPSNVLRASRDDRSLRDQYIPMQLDSIIILIRIHVIYISKRL